MILYESMIDDLNIETELEITNTLFESYLIEFNAKETLNKIWESIKKLV